MVPENWTEQGPFRIGDHEVIPDRNVVRRGVTEQTLEPRLMQVLLVLSSCPGEVVRRQELLDRVWGETIVQEEALTQAISMLRRVLGDDSRSPSLIETVPKRGYRLIAEVTRPDSEAPTGRASAAVTRRRGILGLALAAAAVVVTLVYLGGRDRTATSPVLLDPDPLTSLPGDEIQADVSPDGSMVAFSARPDRASEFKLYRKSFGAEEVVRLTDGDGYETLPCWSPDGEQIAFSRRIGTERRVCVVASIGGPVRELGPALLVDGGLDWSPDGAFIVFSGKNDLDRPMRLFRLEVAGGEVIELTDPETLARGDTYPRWSPDGKRIAFVRSDRGISRAIWTLPTGGGAPEPLTEAFFTCSGLDWHPDGASLVVSAAQRGTFELWRVDAGSGVMRPLPLRGHRCLYPSWSPDGRSLVYTENQLNTDLTVLELEPDTEAKPLAASTRVETEGRFSPDGQSVAFISDRGGSPELWLLQEGQTAPRQLTHLAGDRLGKPRWSPGGDRIALNVGRDGKLQVVVVDPASGMQRQVTPGGVHFRLGHWARDGRSLFCSRETDDDWQITRVEADGAGFVDVDAPGCMSVGESEGGDLYYYKEGEEGLFLRPAGGGEQVALDADRMRQLSLMQLADGGCWFLGAEGETVSLSFLDFATGQEEQRAILTGDVTGSFHVSGGGDRLVYTTVVQTQNDLMFTSVSP